MQIDEHPTVHEIEGVIPEILPPDLVSSSFDNEDNKNVEKPPQIKGILISIENSN